jgi:hypothetical protein
MPVMPGHEREARDTAARRSEVPANAPLHAIQTKLAVGRVDDPLEQDAVRVADRVRMPYVSTGTPGVRKSAGCEEEDALHRKEAVPSGGGGDAMDLVEGVLRAPGQALDPATRAFFEPRFGRDFSGVRVHTDRRAGESARAVGAEAYTVGCAIAFADGRYQPRTLHGRRLLAHELAHVAQQKGAADPVSDLRIGHPWDVAERNADWAAAQALRGSAMAPFSFGAAEVTPTLRRTSVPTWAGNFDNDLQYDPVSQNDGKGEGAYGATIQIRFTPKDVVHADKVALVQTVSSQWNDTNYFIGSAVEAKATEARSTSAGTHIDQINPSSRSPLVGMKDPPATSNDLAESVPGRNARFGTPDAKDPEARKAWLFDPASLGHVPDAVAASQSLEAAALAVSGPQKGVYYGAVHWGWEKAANAKVATLKPFTVSPTGIPSAEFAEASKLWNASTTDQNQQRFALPIAFSKFAVRTGTPLMERADGGKRIAALPLNTRVEITGQTDQKHPDWISVIVTDGSLVGRQGWVKTSHLSDMTRKKSL